MVGAHDHELVAAVQELLDVRARIAKLREQESVLCERISKLHRYGRLDIEGVAVIDVQKGNRRKEWQHDDLYRVLLARSRDERKVDPDTGEVLEDGFATAFRVLRECARPEWRATALRARGIDPGEYCTTSEGPPSVQATPYVQRAEDGAA